VVDYHVIVVSRIVIFFRRQFSIVLDQFWVRRVEKGVAVCERCARRECCFVEVCQEIFDALTLRQFGIDGGEQRKEVNSRRQRHFRNVSFFWDGRCGDIFGKIISILTLLCRLFIHMRLLGRIWSAVG
jgi:hypothetical protein